MAQATDVSNKSFSGSTPKTHSIIVYNPSINTSWPGIILNKTFVTLNVKIYFANSLLPFVFHLTCFNHSNMIVKSDKNLLSCVHYFPALLSPMNLNIFTVQ